MRQSVKRTIGLSASLLIMLLSLLMIIGWLTGSDSLLFGFAGSPKVKFNAALCFLLSSIVLLIFYINEANVKHRFIPVSLSIIISVIGLLTLLEYFFHLNFGIDELFVKDAGAPDDFFVGGRMSPIAALNFFLIGIGLLFFNRNSATVYQFNYLFVIVFSALLIVMGLNFLTAFSIFIRLPVLAAVMFIILGVAIYMAQPVLQQKVSLDLKMMSGFTVVFIFLFLVGFFLFFNNAKRKSTQLQEENSSRIINATDNLLLASKNMMSETRALIITGDQGFVSSILKEKERVEQHLQELEAQINKEKNYKKELDSLHSIFLNQFNYTNRIIQDTSLAEFSAASALKITNEGNNTLNRISLLLSQIQQQEEQKLQSRKEASYQRQTDFNNASLGFLLSVFVLLLFLLLVIRNNANKIRRSKEQFRGLLECAPDAMIIINERGKIVLANQQTDKLFGYERQEIVYQPAEFLVPLNDGLPGGVVNPFKVNSPLVGTILFMNALKKDGTKFPAELTLSPLITDKGSFLTVSVRDITNRKKSEEKIRYQANLIEDISDAVFSVNTDFRIISWNKAAENLYGYTEQEAIGETTTKILNSNLQEDELKAIRKQLIEEGCFKGEIEHTTKSGKAITVFISTSAIKNERGEIDGYVSVCKDISERKMLEEQLKKFNEELEEQIQEKTGEIQDILGRINDGFCALDANGYFTYLNSQAASILSIENKKIVGRNIFDVFPADEERQPFYEEYFKALKEQRNADVEWYSQKFGLWLEFNLYPSPKGLSVFLRNITEKKLAEKALRDAEETRKLIMDSSLNAIISIDLSNQITLWNHQAEEMFGWKEVEMLGKRLADTIIPHQYRAMHEQGFEKYLKTGEGPRA